MNGAPITEAVEIVGESGSRWVAPGRFFFEALEADRLQIGRDTAVRLARPRRRLFGGAAQHFHGCVAGEWRLARKQVIQDCAQTIDIGARRSEEHTSELQSQF